MNTIPTPGDMAAFGASERACYDYPDDTDVAKAQRAAFCAGAGWAADKIERLQEALTITRAWLLRDENKDLPGSDAVYIAIDEALGSAVEQAAHPQQVHDIAAKLPPMKSE